MTGKIRAPLGDQSQRGPTDQRAATASDPAVMVSGAPDSGGLLEAMKSGTWLDKQEFAPLCYHVPGVLPEGLTVLAGAPKVGKSWLVLGWALAAAAGGRALSAIGCEQRHVMYFALEDGDRRMRDRCRKLLDNDYRPRDPIPGEFCYLTRVPGGTSSARSASTCERTVQSARW